MHFGHLIDTLISERNGIENICTDTQTDKFICVFILRKLLTLEIMWVTDPVIMCAISNSSMLWVLHFCVCLCMCTQACYAETINLDRSDLLMGIVKCITWFMEVIRVAAIIYFEFQLSLYHNYVTSTTCTFNIIRQKLCQQV